MPYTHLFFDLDHTLLDFDAAEAVALDLLLAQCGVSDLAAYKAVYIPLNQGLWRDLEQGLISKQDLVNTRFSRLFAHFGQAVDGVELAKAYEQHLSQQGQVYPGAEALLLTLKTQGYRLYAATNGVATIQKGRLKASGLGAHFEAVFISEELGYNKPDARFYGKMAEQVPGFTLGTSLMIGDNQLADIKGARAFGMDTVYYNPKGLAVQAGVAPTLVVESYDELLRFLGDQTKESTSAIDTI